ncbi:TetR/AcrR family transcriptional regulator [Kribbella sp. NPDC049174]|uniref:TetR/AcrR family transcriptional regulator n=1 Tax=Kribbella sp. NPDC049174 TaxID=3364112 RepID=UPI0037110355
MTIRERRRAETRTTIQRHAIRLFVDRGYDATTVNDVAVAAGVSAMTVYRHFATKEDLVLYDEFDQVAAATITELPADEPLVVRIARTLAATYDQAIADREFHLARLRLMISTAALRARHLDSQYATQEALVTALCAGSEDPALEFQARAAASACLGVLHIAVLRWAAEDGRPDLRTLFEEAFTATFGHAF